MLRSAIEIISNKLKKVETEKKKVSDYQQDNETRGSRAVNLPRTQIPFQLPSPQQGSGLSLSLVNVNNKKSIKYQFPHPHTEWIDHNQNLLYQ